jgi:ADP-ribose pyrophosphatase
MICLTSGPPSAGLASEIITFFRAKNLRRINAGLGDGHEQIQVHEVPLASIEQWLEDKLNASVLIDPKVYAGLYFLKREQPKS